MAAKTRAQLKSENASDFPDNVARLISPADLRGQMDDVVDSALFPEDGLSGIPGPPGPQGPPGATGSTDLTNATGMLSQSKVTNLEADLASMEKALQAMAEAIALPPLATAVYGGSWHDFGNPTDCFQDAAHTIPADGDGEPVGGVVDRTGHNFNFSQVTVALQPSMQLGEVGMRSALGTSGTQYLVGEKKTMTNNISRLTIIAAARRDDKNDGRQIIDHKINVAENTRVQVANYPGGGLETRPAVLMRRTDAGAIAIAYGVHGGLEFDEPGPGPWHVYTAIADYVGGKAHFFVDGQQVPEGLANTDSAGMSPTTDEHNVYIGGVGDGLEWMGAIGEIVELPNAVPDSIVSGLGAYMGNRWNIPYRHRPYKPGGNLPAVAGTWFITPRVWRVDATNYVVGGVSQAGSVMAANYNTGTGARDHSYLYKFLQQDDHIAPAFIRLLDGKMLAAFSMHGVDNKYYIVKSTNTAPPFLWGTAVEIGASIEPAGGGGHFTYANLVRLTGEANRIYNVMRYGPNGNENWCITWSNDEGVTWVQAKVLWGPARPYTRPVANGASRIDLVVSEQGGIGSTWHCYYQAGNLYKSNGTLIGALTGGPYPLTSLTTIHDSVAKNTGSYHWDLQISGGNPVVCYTTYDPYGPGNVEYCGHYYQQTRWNGTAWTVNQICEAGGWIGGQPSYSGGMAMDPADVNAVYVARRVDANGNVVKGMSGYTLTNMLTDARHKLFKAVTANGGVTWTLTQITSGEDEHIRPAIAGTMLFYASGRFGPLYEIASNPPSYSFYDMEIVAQSIA